MITRRVARDRARREEELIEKNVPFAGDERAVRRFRQPSRTAHVVELGFYWAAQLMIALSIGR